MLKLKCSNITYTEIVNNLVKKGFRKSEIADICSVSPAAVTSWLNGKEPRKKHLEILRILDLKASEQKGPFNMITKSFVIVATFLTLGGIEATAFSALLKTK